MIVAPTKPVERFRIDDLGRTGELIASATAIGAITRLRPSAINGAEPMAIGDPHGRWIRWLRPS